MKMTSSHSRDSLIVDFPAVRCRNALTTSDTNDDATVSAAFEEPKPIKEPLHASLDSSPKKKNRRNKVVFKPTCSLTVYEPQIEDARSLWYSSQDRKQFKRQRNADALTMRHRRAASASQTFTQEEIVDCIGIEVYLSDKTVRRLLQKRARHMDAVLRAQESFCSEDELCQVSMMHSEWTRKMAHRIASGYCQMQV